MRKLLAIAAAALVAAMGGCGPSAGAGRDSRDSLLVCTSIYPIYDFACKIAGDRAEVRPVMPLGAEPHDWEPTPSDIAALGSAEVFVYNGAGMEHWVDAVLEAVDTEAMLVVEASAEVPGLSAEDHGHDHGDADPHVWLSPQNAKLQMQAIQRAMSEADPQNTGYYKQNYEHWAQELDALDAQFRETLEPLPGKEIVVAHQAFGYLCREYGLTQVAVRGFSPDAEPDPAQMAQVITWAAGHGIKVIFFEQAASPRVAQAIAREIGAETAVLSPLESLSEEQLEAGADYFSVMRENLSALERALS